MTLALASFGVLQAVIYLAFIRFIDLYEREPLRYVIPVFVWGFTVAVALSLIFNELFAFTISSVASVQLADLLTAVVAAPFFEESSKGLALLIVFIVSALVARRRGSVEFSGVMDGIVYGSAVGFGFSMAEDLLYFAQYGSETFVVRRIFGGFAHASFTSLTGIGIGLIPWVGNPLLKPVPPLAGLASAMLLHSVFNTTATFLGLLAYGLLFFVVLAYVVVIVVWLTVERRAIRSELRPEVASGLISEAEYRILPTYFSRTRYYAGLVLSGRFPDYRREKRFHNAAVDLALTKRAAGDEPSQGQIRRIQILRSEAASLKLRSSSRSQPL